MVFLSAHCDNPRANLLFFAVLDKFPKKAKKRGEGEKKKREWRQVETSQKQFLMTR
jgi:hypothetical protein